MKLLVISLLITSLTAFSADERKDYVDQYKKYNKKIEEQIDDLDRITHCDDKPIGEIATCVEEQLNSLSNVDIKKIDEVMGLKTHGLIKSNNKKEVVNFLVSELEKRINKKEKITKRNEKKYIDHVTHFDLHRNRLSKSFLLEISNFCREKVKINPDCHRETPKGPCSSTTPGTKDFKMVSSKTKGELDAELAYLSEPASPDPKTGEPRNLASVLYNQCLTNIKKLCDFYDDNDDTTDVYADACIFQKRVVQYKKTIDQTTELRNELAKNRVRSGYKMQDIAAYSDIYNPTAKELDEITNITSGSLNNKKARELKANTDDISKFCETGKSTPECQEYANVLSKEEFEDIQKEIEKKYAVKKAYIQGVSDEEKLRDFASEYISKSELKIKDDIDKVKDAINTKFQHEKDAIIASIRAQIKGAGTDSDSQVIQKEQDKNKFELNTAGVQNVQQEVEAKSNPNAIRDNIFYSNLVNSYLQKMSRDDPTKTSRNFSLGNAEFASSDNANNDGSEYFNQRDKARQAFEQAQKNNSRNVASELNGNISEGLGTFFNIILFGDPENKE